MADHTVLCVDLDPAESNGVVSRLRGSLDRMEVLTSGSLAEAESLAQDRFIDCVVCEYDLPDGTGFDLVDRLREDAPDTAAILFTDADREAVRAGARDGPVVDVLPRGTPDAVDRLAALIRTTATLRSQTTYPLPQREADRLASLDSYGLDAPTLERPLDRISRLAAEYFDVSIASVNAVKQREQVFLACHGADWTSTTRAESICTYTILDGAGLLEVEDVREDPRFRSVEGLRDAGIRAYLGATLTSADGHPLGTLCVYDDEPREFSAGEREFLRQLARITMDVIELNRHAGGGREP